MVQLEKLAQETNILGGHQRRNVVKTSDIRMKEICNRCTSIQLCHPVCDVFKEAY